MKGKEGNGSGRSWQRAWLQVGTIVQSQDALKLVFGLGLLFYGRSLPHLILFTHAFKVDQPAATVPNGTAPSWPTPVESVRRAPAPI